MDNLIIKECMKNHPEAISEVEAVDLEAQAVYKDMQKDFGTKPMDQVQVKISKYNYLRDLRSDLNRRRIEEMSSFARKN